MSRSLRDELGLHVLALDFNEIQTHGAARREESSKRSTKQLKQLNIDRTTNGVQNINNGQTDLGLGTLDYETITIDAESLVSVTDRWMTKERPLTSETTTSCQLHSSHRPILWVALHACGSLTLDILRAFVRRLRQKDESSTWSPVGAFIVGCCYNMLRPEGESVFCQTRALSRPLTSQRRPFFTDRVLARKDVTLTPNHLQLAAQTPDQWATSPAKFEETKLAMRKIVWRALLERVLAVSIVPTCSGTGDSCSGLGSRPEVKRLGRLNDGAYCSWEQFLTLAEERMGVSLSGDGLEMDGTKKSALESRLEVFHVLRCILGPVVESFILLDRERWLCEGLKVCHRV